MLSQENLWLLYKQSVVSPSRGSSGRAMYGILGSQFGAGEGRAGEGEERGGVEGDRFDLSYTSDVSYIFKSAKMENTFIFSVKIFSSENSHLPAPARRRYA